MCRRNRQEARALKQAPVTSKVPLFREIVRCRGGHFFQCMYFGIEASFILHLRLVAILLPHFVSVSLSRCLVLSFSLSTALASDERVDKHASISWVTVKGLEMNFVTNGGFD